MHFSSHIEYFFPFSPQITKLKVIRQILIMLWQKAQILLMMICAALS